MTRSAIEPHPLLLFASISRLHIVAIAALGTLTFGWLFLGERPWLLAAVAALDWFIVNLLNRVVDLDEDRVNRITGVAFVDAHRRAILWCGVGVLAVSLVAVHVVLPALLPLRLAFHALGFAYNWPLFPGRRRIKQLYFWKNTASAMGFVLTVFCFPLIGQPISGTVLTCFYFFVLFELSYEVIYDLRDAPGDAATGVRTYPVVHGQAGAVRIIDALLLGSFATLVVGYLTGLVPWRIAIMAAAPVVQLVLYKAALRRPGGITSSDCIRLTWVGAGLLATYHVWVELDLPGVS